MQATDVDRQCRALALGLPQDAAWEAIAEAEVAASLHADTQKGPAAVMIVSSHGQPASPEPEVQSDDEDGEFHDVEEKPTRFV